MKLELTNEQINVIVNKLILCPMHEVEGVIMAIRQQVNAIVEESNQEIINKKIEEAKNVELIDLDKEMNLS